MALPHTNQNGPHKHVGLCSMCESNTNKVWNPQKPIASAVGLSPAFIGLSTHLLSVWA